MAREFLYNAGSQNGIVYEEIRNWLILLGHCLDNFLCQNATSDGTDWAQLSIDISEIGEHESSAKGELEGR